MLVFFISEESIECVHRKAGISQDWRPLFLPRLSQEDAEAEALLPRMCTDPGGPFSSVSSPSSPAVDAAAFVREPAMTPFISALN